MTSRKHRRGFADTFRGGLAADNPAGEFCQSPNEGCRLTECCGDLLPFIAAASGDDHTGAFCNEQCSDGGTDATGTTGDDGHLSGECADALLFLQ